MESNLRGELTSTKPIKLGIFICLKSVFKRLIYNSNLNSIS